MLPEPKFLNKAAGFPFSPCNFCGTAIGRNKRVKYKDGNGKTYYAGPECVPYIDAIQEQSTNLDRLLGEYETFRAGRNHQGP